MIKRTVYQSSEIFYRLEGEGIPVLLVHGFAEDNQVWDLQVDFLQKKFRVIVPDLPGSGRSPAIPDMSMEGLAECLRHVLEKENPDGHRSTIWIGHSMGGYVCLAFAEKYPDRLGALGLFHSTANPDSDEKKKIRQKGIEFIRQYGSRAFIQQTTPNLFSDEFKKKHPEIVKSLISRYADFLPQSLIAYYVAMMKRPDRTAVLQEISKPMLFFMGEQDKAIPMEDMLRQCHLPSVSYICIGENLGHMGMMEDPDLSNLFLDNFCSHHQYPII